MRKPSRQQRREAAAERLEAEVHEAMIALGWTVPTAAAAVGAAEAALAGEAPALPASLRDPRAVRDGRAEATVRPMGGAEDVEGIDVPLARAAREGGRIGPEIERRMREDRLAAERERDDETPGPTETP